MKTIQLLVLFAFISIKGFAQCLPGCYTYSQSAITYSQFPTGGTNIISQLSPSIDDGITSPLPIGFSFKYYCTTYTAVLICSNGFIQMDMGSPPSLSFANPSQAFPDPTSPNGIIALNMNDFDPNMGGSITYTTIGTAPNRMFVVTYSQVPIWSYNSSINSGQIVLYETSDRIEIHSASINSSGTNIYTGTQGIENQSGSSGSCVSGRSNSTFQVTTPDAYRWTPITTYTPAPLTGTITGPSSVCIGTSANYSLATPSATQTFSWALPGGWSGGTSTTTAISIPTVGFSGTVAVMATYTCGNSNPITYSVTSMTPPFISLASILPSTICAGETSTITVNGGATYTLQPGAVPVGNVFTVSPAAGVYQLSVYGTGANGCDSPNPATTTLVVNSKPTVSASSGTICLGGSYTIQAGGATNYTYSTTFPTMSPAAVGIYTYEVIGSFTTNCSDTAQGSLKVNPNPTVTTSANRTSICAKESVSLTASGASTYSWSNGVSTGSQTLSLTSNTVLSVVGTSSDGCVGTSSISITVKACTGVDEQNATTVQLVPNPTHGAVNYALSGDYRNCQMQVYDAQGKLVQTIQPVANEDVIHLEAMPSGLYYLQLRDGSSVKTVKLVKE